MALIAITDCWQPPLTRRGDPLGFLDLAHKLSEHIIPGLSNRTRDCRWLTLLGYSLLAARRAAPRELPDDRLAFYRWLHPLERLWVWQCAQLLGDAEQKERRLPGIRRARNARSLATYMQYSEDQVASYRFTGPYGSYRLLLRDPRLTDEGDGWAVTEPFEELCRDVLAVPVTPVCQLARIRPRAGTEPHSYWLRNDRLGLLGMESGAKALRDRHLLPVGRDLRLVRGLVPTPSARERAFYKSLLFGDDLAGRQRRATLKALAAGRTLSTSALRGASIPNTDRRLIQLLISFDEWSASLSECLHRAAIIANLCRPTVAELIGELEAVGIDFASLRKKSATFAQASSNTTKAGLGLCAVPAFVAASRLASSLQRAKTSVRLLEQLVQHHQAAGGGKRWLKLVVEGATRIVATLSIDPDSAAPAYGFRQMALARLAVQCGMPNTAALVKKPQARTIGDDDDEEEGDA
ncbi:MAG TPA: hypothetical protein VGQ83_09080 [Polyangia bacterium]